MTILPASYKTASHTGRTTMARKKVDPAVSEYMSRIGRKGGKKTAKKFTSEQAKRLAEKRWKKVREKS